jgi:hypothetical protein
VSRENSRSAGNARGGVTLGAILASLSSTRRRHQVAPRRYLTQFLTNIADTPVSQLDR